MTNATLRTPAALADAGLLHRVSISAVERVAARYAIAISPSMQALVDRNDPADPIARQFVPDPRELDVHLSETADPIGDHVRSPIPGIVHRYPDRVLLKLTGVCPVYCRFCFRREMVGPSSGHNPDSDEIAAAVAYIASDPAIFEVIATGGDPFMLSPRRIGDVCERLGAVDHVRVMRWHTRVPVVAPELVTAGLLRALATFPRARYVGLHINHPRELTPEARAAIARLAEARITLVSQTVLLRGINDDPDVLEGLMRALVEAQVVPYYLHHGDLAPGTGHFRVPIARGQSIAREISRRLTGIARPSYVLDVPGGFGKIDLLSANVTALKDGTWQLTDANGRIHIYRDACAD